MKGQETVRVGRPRQGQDPGLQAQAPGPLLVVQAGHRRVDQVGLAVDRVQGDQVVGAVNNLCVPAGETGKRHRPEWALTIGCRGQGRIRNTREGL